MQIFTTSHPIHSQCHHSPPFIAVVFVPFQPKSQVLDAFVTATMHRVGDGFSYLKKNPFKFITLRYITTAP